MINRNNLTPLQVAAHANQQEVVSLLMSMEVDTEQFNRDCEKGFLSKEITELYSSKTTLKTS